MIQRPLLIAVEGCDGTGKTTLVSALVSAFLSLGIPAASIKRPAKDALAAFYAQGQAVTDSQVLAMMNADCRATIDTARTMQSNGTPVIIFDRHYLSAAIYQGGSDWQGEFERQRERWGEPDLWVFCDSYAEEVAARIYQRDRDHDKETPLETIGGRLAQYQWMRRHVRAPWVEYWSIGLSALTIVARYSWDMEDHFEGNDGEDFAEWMARKIKRMPDELHP
mgnify:FL=1